MENLKKGEADADSLTAHAVLDDQVASPDQDKVKASKLFLIRHAVTDFNVEF